MYYIFPLMCKNTFLMRELIKSINSRYIWYSQVVKITILNGLRKLWHYIYFKQFKNSYVQITLSMCQFQLMFLPPSSLYCMQTSFCLQTDSCAKSSSCFYLQVAYFFCKPILSAGCLLLHCLSPFWLVFLW